MSDFFRGRRLRRTGTLREMVRETFVRPKDLIMPYFVVDTPDQNMKKPIASMPGQYQLSLDMLEETVARAVDMGLRSCLLFGIPAMKNETGSEAWAEHGIVQRAIQRLKSRFSRLVVTTDVCLCEYTSHGHCGILDPAGQVRNDATLEILAKTALSHAQAGADIVGPSDMMDGRVQAIRATLDENGFQHIPVMSYAVKYSSAFYGPFREAAESAPQFGNRKTYQMDPANGRESMREAMADIAEGADMLIVKPAGHYLDVLHELRQRCDLPLAAYQVSGEYAMIKAAGANGWIDERAIALETLLGIKRAGADLIITYFTEELLEAGVLA
ncbi:porphobilinogen synthase [Desulfovibrio sp. OttesenSCG-928-I05]|nr:porphobilinogen synthase [Desulfovibrio sp. OttesenSCG-928-I05]